MGSRKFILSSQFKADMEQSLQGLAVNIGANEGVIYTAIQKY